MFIVACKKQEHKFNPYLKLKANGKDVYINACGTSAKVAQYLKDTAVFIALQCGGLGAGFYLKGNIVDGTYPLNNNNLAWFDDYPASFATDSTNLGSITIKSGVFTAQGGQIPFIEGSFSYKAKEKTNGQIANITNGTFKLTKNQY
jgi:hypothetical protein